MKILLDASLGTGSRAPKLALRLTRHPAIAVSAYNLGCFLGACTCIWVGNYLGRKRTIFLGSVVMIIGATLQCTAFSTPQFIVGRIVTGFGNDLNTSTVPTWQSETSKSHRRGQLVMLEGTLIVAGVMISYWIDFGFYFIGEQTVAWRFPLAFQIFFALIISTTVLGLPESPRWLILKGREEEALEVLEALNRTSREDKYIQNEFDSIKETVAEMSKGSFRDLFTMHPESRHLHRTILAYVNQMFQQISGINLITYYAPIIYTTIGLKGYLPALLTACNGTEYFMASLIAIAVVEKVGRRKLMLLGAAGMSLGMVALTISTKYSDEGNKHAGIGSAFFLFFFNTFFAVGWLGKFDLDIDEYSKHIMRLHATIRNDMALPCGDCSAEDSCAGKRIIYKCKLAVQFHGGYDQSTCLCKYWLSNIYHFRSHVSISPQEFSRLLFN